MSSLAQWSAIVAAFVPIIVSVLAQEKWKSYYKTLVFFCVTLVAAAGTAYFNGDLTGKRFVDSILIIAPAAGAFYYAWWKPTLGPTVERVTSFSKDKSQH